MAGEITLEEVEYVQEIDIGEEDFENVPDDVYSDMEQMSQTRTTVTNWDNETIETGKWQLEIGDLTITSNDLAIGSTVIFVILLITMGVSISYCIKRRKKVAALATRVTIAVRSSIRKTINRLSTKKTNDQSKVGVTTVVQESDVPY